MFSEVTKMNIFDIPGHNFDEILEYFENVISRYKGKISPPKYHHMHRIELLTTVINHLERIRSNSEKELTRLIHKRIVSRKDAKTQSFFYLLLIMILPDIFT